MSSSNETNNAHSRHTQHKGPSNYIEDSYNLRSPQQQKCVHRLKERKIQCINIEKNEHITTYYTMLKVMGKGTYGVVYAARENRNNAVWAIKILTKKEGKIMKAFENEIEILKFVDHPNITRLNSIVESPTSVYLVLDLCDGVLSNLFKSRKVLTEVETRVIIKELCSAVSYLHNNGIVHRDIKMENILLVKDASDTNDSKFTTKLTDFGLSTIKSGATYKDMMHDRCGTLAYMAPEVVTKRSYSQQCDVWAMGVVLYTLLSGELPFARATENTIIDAITREEPNFKILKVENIDCVVHLIQRLLHKDPAHRSTAIEILDHPWILELPLNELKSGNVLDMMAQWRDELNVQSLEEPLEAMDTATPFLHKIRRNSRKCSTLSKTKTRNSGVTGKRRSMEPLSMERTQQMTETILETGREQAKVARNTNRSSTNRKQDVRKRASKDAEVYSSAPKKTYGM